MITNLELFVCTVEEYKRFSDFLKIKEPDSMLDEYSESDYIGIQVRLMLLRKYYAGKEAVRLNKVIEAAIRFFPEKSNALTELTDRLNRTEETNMEHILSDSTKLNLYETIEDAVYGLYLHADQNRIERLYKTAEEFRVICTRKYILEIEQIVFAVYDILKECGVKSPTKDINQHAPILRLEKHADNQEHASKNKGITGSPYWKNMDGHDVTQDDLDLIESDTTPEEARILLLCAFFFNELRKEKPDVVSLKKVIHPYTRLKWGNFSEAKRYVDNIPNPGFSTRVRYSENQKLAYVRIHPNVIGEFTIDSPQIMMGLHEFALYKWRGEWKIYSFGAHLDSV